MKVTVLQENLARGLGMVAKAVSPRSTLPVLANILIASDEGRLRLSATNLEMGITCWIPARIDEEGSTTVPARTFSDLVSTLPSDQVLLKLDPATQTLNVRGGTSTNDIKCIDAQEFPPPAVADFNNAVQINVGDFREMIHQVAFAASSDEARPHRRAAGRKSDDSGRVRPRSRLGAQACASRGGLSPPLVWGLRRRADGPGADAGK